MPPATDVVELGPPHLRRAPRAVLVAVALLAAGGLGAYRWQDARQTLSQPALQAAIAAFRPETYPEQARVLTPEEVVHDLRTDPPRCAALLDPGGDRVSGGVTWLPRDGAADPEIEAVRYPDPTAARTAVTGLRTALAGCPRLSILPRQEGDGGVALETVATVRPWWSLRPRPRFTLTATDPGAFPGYAVDVQRYGNVVVWSYGEPAATVTQRTAVGQLVTELGRQAGR